jgi:hypothetical protein
MRIVLSSQVADLGFILVTREEAEQDGAKWSNRRGTAKATTGAIQISH